MRNSHVFSQQRDSGATTVNSSTHYLIYRKLIGAAIIANVIAEMRCAIT